MDKQTKRQLRTPDQFWQASRTMMDWLSEHWMGPVIVVVAALVIMVGVVFSFQIRHQKEANAQFHLAKVYSLYSQYELQQGDDQAKTKTALDAELAILADQFTLTDANAYANVIRAKLNPVREERLPLYEEFETSLSRTIKPFGLYPLALTNEELQKWEAALANYNEILDRKDSAFETLALLGKGRVLRHLNRHLEANEVYSRFLEKYPQSPEAGEVRGLMALLDLDPKSSQ